MQLDKGEVQRDDFTPDYGLTTAAGADAAKVSRHTIDNDIMSLDRSDPFCTQIDLTNRMKRQHNEIVPENGTPLKILPLLLLT